MLTFKFRKEKLIHSPEIYLIPEFTDIMAEDTSTTKTKSNRMFLYIFYMCDLTEDNPRRDDGDLKHENSYKVAFQRNNMKIRLTNADKELLTKGMNAYIKYNETAEERLLPTFDEKAEQLRHELDSHAPEAAENISDGVQYYVSNASLITKGLSELSQIKKKREIIVSAIRRESMVLKVRGKMKLSPLSKGDIALFKDSEAKLFQEEQKTPDEAKTIQRESLDRIDQLKADQFKKRRKVEGQ